MVQDLEKTLTLVLDYRHNRPPPKIKIAKHKKNATGMP